MTPILDDDRAYARPIFQFSLNKRTAAFARLHRPQHRRATHFVGFALLILAISPIFAKSLHAQEETVFHPLTCGAPMPVGAVVVVRDAKGIIVGRIKGESQNKSAYYDKYGRRQGWVVFKNSNCEIRDRFGRITYRGTWQ